LVLRGEVGDLRRDAGCEFYLIEGEIGAEEWIVGEHEQVVVGNLIEEGHLDEAAHVGCEIIV
jgi:hypothetical protein